MPFYPLVKVTHSTKNIDILIPKLLHIKLARDPESGFQSPWVRTNRLEADWIRSVTGFNLTLTSVQFKDCSYKLKNSKY